MPSSNNTIFQLTVQQLVEAALRKLTVLEEGQSSNADQLSTGTQALNTLVAALQTEGLLLWTRQEITVPLTASTTTYSIGIGQTVNTRFPTDIEQVLVKQTSSGSTVELTKSHSKDILRLNDTNTGTPVQYSYTPYINYGQLRVWPAPTTEVAADYTLLVTSFTPLEYATASTETMYFPQEWHLSLIYELALLLADEYGKSLEERQWLSKLAGKYTKAASENTQEPASLFLYPLKR